jgi:hypothetical protein
LGSVSARDAVFVRAELQRQGDLFLPVIRREQQRQREKTRMRVRILIAVLAVMAAIGSSVAWAKCPPGTSYSCYQGFNGKMICGCR